MSRFCLLFFLSLIADQIACDSSIPLRPDEVKEVVVSTLRNPSELLDVIPS